MTKLAIDGGERVRENPFPSDSNHSGRDLGEEEIKLLSEVIRSGSLNRESGTKVKEFEAKFADKLGLKYAIASTSGTAAVHVAVAAINPDPGDEIITTPLTDTGTVIAIIYQGAIPVFADVHPITGNLDLKSIEENITDRTRAIIVVHLFGQPCDIDPILDLARRYKLKVVEDSAQSHFAEYKWRKVGTIGDMGCFSLQQSKQVTTGDGGITVTDDENLAHRAMLFANKCYPRRPGESGIPFLGMNYRMTELQGAVGLAQLGKVEGILERRRKSGELLSRLLRDVKGINSLYQIEGVIHSYWMYSFTIDEELVGLKTIDFMKALNAEGIPFHLGYGLAPLRELPMRAPLLFEYEEVLRDRVTFGRSHWPFDAPGAREITYDSSKFPNAIAFQGKVLAMSWNEGITEDDVNDIAAGVKKVAEYYMKK